MLKPYLRSWIPAIKKLAYGRNVTLTDKEIESTLRDADLWLFKHDTANFTRQECKPETVARAIKAVFYERFQQLVEVASVRRRVFQTDSYRNYVHNSVIPRGEFFDLFSR